MRITDDRTGVVWRRRRAAPVVVLLGGVAALLAGCQQPTVSVETRLLEGEQAFRAKAYDRAVADLTAYLAQERPAEAARARYVRGMALALTGRRADAYKDLQYASQAGGQGELTWQPYAALGVLYFEDEHWDVAARLFIAALERMPEAPPRDALLYRVALCQERSGRWREARGRFEQVAARYAGGTYGTLAQRRLALGADHYAIQCGVFGQRQNAERLVEDLGRRGLRTYVRAEQRGGDSFHIVLEGRYETYAAAKLALARVRGYVPQAVMWP